MIDPGPGHRADRKHDPHDDPPRPEDYRDDPAQALAARPRTIDRDGYTVRGDYSPAR